MTQPVPNIADERKLRVLLAYTAVGWHIFPLFEITSSGNCACPDASACGNPGKHPRIPRGFLNATTAEQQIRAWHKRWPRTNWGVACGASRLAVVDVDPRNGGDDTLADLEQANGALPHTPRAVTGGGGQHYLYAMPDGDPVRSGVLGLGVDLKADGGYIVVAPSNHVSGTSYAWDVGALPTETPLATLPQWILQRLRTKEAAAYEPGGAVTDGYLGAAFDAQGWLGRGLGPDKAAARCPWEDEHSGGKRFDSSTVIFAPTKGYRVGWFWCSHSHCAHRTLSDVMNQLSPEAKAKARQHIGADEQYSPEAEQAEQSTVKPIDVSAPWAKMLRFNEEQRLTKDPANAALIIANLDQWQGCLEYDEFADRLRWVRPVPEMAGLTPPRPGDDLSDHHVTYVHHWLAKFRRVSFPKAAIQDALELAARMNTRHPVRDYFNSIPWDGKFRISTWLRDYLGAEDLPHVQASGRWWLISAVARVFDPGCQADHIIVFEGQQGAGKSSAARILGGEWFLANLPDITNKDAAQVLQGHLIVEIGELDAFRGAAGTRVKDWLTRTTDSFRPAYGRFTVRRPRQCVFVGTTNEDRYLSDATGGRRFWPVKTGNIDRDALIRDRDQLWAEAREHYLSGEQWWPDDTMQAQLREVQEERYAGDEWETKIGGWLTTSDWNGFTLGEVMGTVLDLKESDWDIRTQTRVGLCLRRLGYEWKQRRENGGRVRRYYKNGGAA
jgi:hypothetical protein